MKFVYVLTSSENDAYYEQFLLSITSFRMYNPASHVVVLIDAVTKLNLTGKRAGYEPLVSEIQVIDVPEKFNQKEASRYIKTSIHRSIDDDFLFIDCDTVIAGKLECNFSDDNDAGAVLDNHTKLQAHRVKNEIIETNRRLGFDSITGEECYYNGGLVFCRNTPRARALFEKWHELWLLCREKGHSQDMPALNRANAELGGIIRELDGTWNCQIAFGGLPFLYNAKIIHYYASELQFYSSPYSLSSAECMAQVKQTGAVPDYVLKLLRKPLSAFEPDARIIADKNQLEVLNSSLFAKLMYLKKRHPALFASLDTITAGLTKKLKKAAGDRK
jgi:hypothetical protein